MCSVDAEHETILEQNVNVCEHYPLLANELMGTKHMLMLNSRLSSNKAYAITHKGNKQEGGRA